jgi:hypothetical protein
MDSCQSNPEGSGPQAAEVGAIEYPIQVLFLLNAEGDHSEAEIIPHVNPARFQLIPCRFSDFTPPPIVREDGKRLQVDWDGCVGSIEDMIRYGREKGIASGRPVEFYVAGLAPLPLFTCLGMKMSAWGPPVTFLNRRQTNQWDVLKPVGRCQDSEGQFFDVVQGLSEGSPCDGTGYVALYVSTNSESAPREKIRTALREDGKELTAVIELRTNDSKYLDSTNSVGAAEHLARLVSRIPGTYPHAAGLGVFVFGPSSLAYLVGRSINPTMFTEVLIGNYQAPNYDIVLRWPRSGRRIRPIAMEEEDLRIREQVLHEVRNGILEVQETIQVDDLPDFMSSNGKRDFLSNIHRVSVPTAPSGESFELQVLQGRMILGHGLLETLRHESQESIRRIAALLFLHEVYHFNQHLHSANFRNIGRAGVALEEIDFWADTVAVCALTLRDLRTASTGGNKPAGCYIEANVGSVLSGIEAFDRFEQGARIDRLAERRLRRYLIWHLQSARARTNPCTRNAVQDMLADRLIVELGPLVGPSDSRYEKLVNRPHSTTELHVVLDRKLFRYSSNAYISPGRIIECVRNFDRKGLEDSMDHVVIEHHQDLAPWATLRP